jgi:hypothetical protein
MGAQLAQAWVYRRLLARLARGNLKTVPLWMRETRPRREKPLAEDERRSLLRSVVDAIRRRR